MSYSDFLKIRKRLKEYFSLLKEYQDRGNVDVQMTFDRGYWLSENDDLNHCEQYFLQEVGDGEELMVFLSKAEALSENAIADGICLLGWAANKKKSGGVLEKYMKHGSIHIATTSARALFPLVASEAYIPKKAGVVALLHRRSKFAKNKALGLLAFLPNRTFVTWMDKHLSNEIQLLAQHKDRFIVGNVATLVINRLK